MPRIASAPSGRILDASSFRPPRHILSRAVSDENALSERPRDDASTSSSLIRRVQRNEQEAWHRLCDLYGPLVYHWCRRSGLQAEDAADVVQEVFRSLTQHIESFRKDRKGDTFRGWLWTITRNKIRDFLRVQADKPLAAGGTDAAVRLSQVPDQLPDTTDDTGRSAAQNRLVRRALDLIRPEFAETTWRAFCRTALEGLTSSEAAAELGMTPQAVRKAKSRVLRRLREELGEAGD